VLKRWAQNLALMLASLVVAIAILELGLRAADVSYPLLQDRDEQRGFALRPGASGWWKREGEAFVRINSDGLRDREHDHAKPDDTIRVAILGDSYAEARSVALEDTFWSVLERALQECQSRQAKNVEVINFGVTDYGTAQELLTLRHQVWKYAPDVVVLAFFPGNDIRNNSRVLEHKAYRPFFTYDGNDLVLDDSFKKTFAYRLLDSWYGQLMLGLSDYFRTVQVARQAMVRTYVAFKKGTTRQQAVAGTMDEETDVEAGLDYRPIFNDPEDRAWQEAWQVTERLLATMAQEIDSHGAHFLVVTLTTGLQVYPDRRTRDEMMIDLGVSDLFYPDRRIQALGEREGFAVLSLAMPFQAYADAHGVFLHGFDNTALGKGHWNEDGHRLAGNLIARRLCEDWADRRAPAAPSESS
jgi:hypothetical protein